MTLPDGGRCELKDHPLVRDMIEAAEAYLESGRPDPEDHDAAWLRQAIWTVEHWDD